MKKVLFVSTVVMGLLAPLPGLESVAPVDALCAGSGNPQSIRWNVSAGVFNASERPSSGTCDELWDYNGTFQDNRADGSDIRMQWNWWDGSGWRSSVNSAVVLNQNYWWGWPAAGLWAAVR